MTNGSLAESCLFKASKRLKVLHVLLEEEANAQLPPGTLPACSVGPGLP